MTDSTPRSLTFAALLASAPLLGLAYLDAHGLTVDDMAHFGSISVRAWVTAVLFTWGIGVLASVGIERENALLLGLSGGLLGIHSYLGGAYVLSEMLPKLSLVEVLTLDTLVTYPGPALWSMGSVAGVDLLVCGLLYAEHLEKRAIAADEAEVRAELDRLDADEEDSKEDGREEPAADPSAPSLALGSEPEEFYVECPKCKKWSATYPTSDKAKRGLAGHMGRCKEHAEPAAEAAA